jgi:CHASE2 domain-containing sensor protein
VRRRVKDLVFYAPFRFSKENFRQTATTEKNISYIRFQFYDVFCYRMKNYLTDTLLCTLFVLGFLGLLYTIPGHFDLFKPLAHTLEDFEMTDIIYSRRTNDDGSSYNLQDDYVPADTNVVLVNIGMLNREGIAAEINIINAHRPKLIAIDTVFERSSSPDADRQLAGALSGVENLVLGRRLIGANEEKGGYDSLAPIYEPFYANAKVAYLNLNADNADAEGKYQVARSFVPKQRVADTTMLSFAAQIAQIAYPKAYKRLLNRGQDHELINFRRTEYQYTVLDLQDIFNPELAVSLKNKIVIMGYMGPSLGSQSWEVKYFTPLNEKYIGKTAPDMFEVTIHANIVSMIHEGDYLNEMSKWLCALIGVLLCMLNVLVFLWVNRWLARWYDAITKTIQFIEIIVLLYVVLLIFSHFRYKIDLTLGLTALLFAGDLLEIYVAVVKNIALVIKRRMRGEEPELNPET